MLGALLYTEGNALRIDVGRSDYEDHRDSTQQGPAARFARLPVGHFMLKPVGVIQPTSQMRLDIYNAQTSASIVTDKGTIQFKLYVHSDRMLLILESKTTGEERNYTLAFVPDPAMSPRQKYGIDHQQPSRLGPNYPLNPAPRFGTNQLVNYCEQTLLFGGQMTTAWKDVKSSTNRVLIASTTHTYPAQHATAVATAAVNAVQPASLPALDQSHKRWWHAYYPASFVSLPDARYENFYWIQLYKLASATRPNRALIDDQGPWLEPTPWPYATWNLNVQLTYWLAYTANHADMGQSLTGNLWKYRINLSTNVPTAYRTDSYGIGRATGTDLTGSTVTAPNGKNAPEIGNLTWACHNVVYMHYRHTMNTAMLGDTLFPLLRGSVNFYLHFLTTDGAGKLHLPPTLSPEYDHTSSDMNFDLSLLRWGCKTLLAIDTLLAINDKLKPRWQQVVDKLIEYPADTNGFMMGHDLPYASSHRHYSHLLMIYPLYDVNIDQAGGRELIDKSLRYWQSKKGALRGYSFTGAASIAAATGDGNTALAYLNGLWDGGFLLPNTLYKEDGPVIETPLSGAQSIHDMLLQSWGYRIRVFPAMPTAWADVSYHNLSAEGGFLISAVRQKGQTAFVTIQSQAGEPCIVNPNIAGRVVSSNPAKFKLTKLANGFYRIPLKKGDSITLYAKSTKDFMIRPVDYPKESMNYYGSKAMNRVK